MCNLLLSGMHHSDETLIEIKPYEKLFICDRGNLYLSKITLFPQNQSWLVIYYRIFIKIVLIALQEVEILEFDKDNFKIRAVG